MKKTKIKYTVDLNEIKYLEDIDVCFALAKHNAGLALSDRELMDIIDYAIDKNAIDVTVLNIVECTCEKKRKPWYKRLWNWIRRK